MILLQGTSRMLLPALLIGILCHAREVAVAGETPVRHHPWMTGVNLAGAEFNPGKTRINVDYTYPTIKETDYFVSKGLTTFRIPVLGDRLVSPEQAINPASADWIALTALIDHAAKVHATVIIDLHQYGLVRSGVVGRDERATREFATMWGLIARRLHDRANVVFGLMNEPHQQTAAEWLSGANAAIAAIRATGSRQLILVPGAYWDGAQSWASTDNSVVMAGVEDPGHNFAYEVHQYLDSDSSGTKPDVVLGSGSTRLAAFTEWASQHNAKGFLGEFGFSDSPEALKEGRAMLQYIKEHQSSWIGWTYWAAGPWWGNYMFSVEENPTGQRKQMLPLMEQK